MPMSFKEGLLFGGIIAFLSCLIIGGYNIWDQKSFDSISDYLVTVFKSLPLVWLFAFIVSNTYAMYISNRIVRCFIKPGDSINVAICYNLIPCSLIMAVSMSFFGPLAGMIVGGNANLSVAADVWTGIVVRNFAIAFWVEMLIAQPTARAVMKCIHVRKASKRAQPVESQHP